MGRGMPWGHPVDTCHRVPRCGHVPWGTGRRRSGCAAGTGGRWPSPTPWGGCHWPWHVPVATWPWSPASRSCRCRPRPHAVTCPACTSPPRSLPAPTQVWHWHLVPSLSSVTVSFPGLPVSTTVAWPLSPCPLTAPDRCHCHHIPPCPPVPFHGPPGHHWSPPAFPRCVPCPPPASLCAQVSKFPLHVLCSPLLCSLCIPCPSCSLSSPASLCPWHVPMVSPVLSPCPVCPPFPSRCVSPGLNPPTMSPLSPGLSTASSLSSPSGLSEGPGSVPLPPGPPGPSEDESWGVAVPPSPPEDALAPPSDTLQVKAGDSQGSGHPQCRRVPMSPLPPGRGGDTGTTDHRGNP